MGVCCFEVWCFGSGRFHLLELMKLNFWDWGPGLGVGCFRVWGPGLGGLGKALIVAPGALCGLRPEKLEGLDF